MTPGYWLTVFSVETWEEFGRAGGTVLGYRPRVRATVNRIKLGDRLLCYLSRVGRFVAVLEVQSESFTDETRIWKSEPFPIRLRVKNVVSLVPETAVPVKEVQGEIPGYREARNVLSWAARFQSSPSKWSDADGEAILNLLRAAAKHPVSRPIPEGTRAAKSR